MDEQPSRRVAVIGLGLVGGSIGLVCRAGGHYVVGYDSSRRAASRAWSLGIVDSVVSALDEMGDADVAFVATPPDAVVPIARHLLDMQVPLVTDVAGASKAAIVAAVNHPRFVSGHPMAGSEVSGCGGSRADLFERANWLVTPVPHTDRHAVDRLVELIASFGARPVELPPEAHDELVACVSHVPHVAATALALLAGRRRDASAAICLAGRGFRDMTRIAKGDAMLWTQLLAGNQVLAAQLRALGEIVVALAEAIAGSDRPTLQALLEAGRDAALLPDQPAA